MRLITIVRLKDSEKKKLFGCPEDWSCDLIKQAQADGRQPRAGQSLPEWHDELCEFFDRPIADRGIVRMCKDCRVPVCTSCRGKLWQADGKSNVPMSLANDNWYGYVQDIIARLGVRWIECACASICWTSQIIYHLEEPYGHLMANDMRGAEGRTAVRGTVTSFPMPAEAILRNLQAAIDRSALIPMPHDGKVLSILVRLHLTGKVEAKKYLKEFEIRADVVVQLFRELVSRGFPGYVNYRIDDLEKRTRELFGKPGAAFVPVEVLKEIESSAKTKEPRHLQREPWDKSATPAEPQSAEDKRFFETMRRQIIMSERDGNFGKDEHATDTVAFSEFSDLKIETGSELIDQWKTEYLCTAMPFTLALPVGGHDVKGKARWRRPKDAAEVELLDLVRGLPRRVEAQFRRHWAFVPALWNLYFRERINFGKHLSTRQRPKGKGSEPATFDHDEDDKARIAGRLYKRLEKGVWVDANGRTHRIAGDTTKLYFAVGTTDEERRLLRDHEFLTSMIPGSQAIRRRMGRLGFSAALVYGQGLFITISPSERHGGLAIRLSRYREGDPLLKGTHAKQEQKWIGKDKPSLETHDDRRGGDEPDYETRKLILARDPLCAVEAFTVHVRVVLACLLGIRMCPECPHCNLGNNPCQDKFGSNAEAQGGSLGRCDALFGAVETQKSGVLHYHMKAFIQRLHQHPRRSYDDDASAWTPNRRIQLVLLCVAVAHLGNRSYFLCVFP